MEKDRSNDTMKEFWNAMSYLTGVDYQYQYQPKQDLDVTVDAVAKCIYFTPKKGIEICVSFETIEEMVVSYLTNKNEETP
jgi:hypothetical protein